MTAPARAAAYRALWSIAVRREDLPAALDRVRVPLADPRDRALALEITTGTLRWQRALDYLIERLAGRPLSRLDGQVVVILRLSLYQLLHHSRVPASAVVHDAVALTREVKKSSAAGLVNAVLRTALRQRKRLPLPSRPEVGAEREAVLAYLGITGSHPEWLVSRWYDRYGPAATERWVQFNNETPQTTLRINTLRGTWSDIVRSMEARGIIAEPTRYAPQGLVVTSGQVVGDLDDGRVFVQDEASQLVPLVVGAVPGDRVLDVCAAPGGKTVAMANDMQDRGVVVACDTRPRRIELLARTVRASGARHTHVVRVAAQGGLPVAPSMFDRVLVDAPCSGLGTVRRDPDIRWRRSEDELAELARTQAALLTEAAEAVRPGGRLVYATCSSEPEENEDVVDAFLRTHPDYQVVDLRTHGNERLASLVDDRGMLRTLPFAHDLEAFFAAALQRRIE